MCRWNWLLKTVFYAGFSCMRFSYCLYTSTLHWWAQLFYTTSTLLCKSVSLLNCRYFNLTSKKRMWFAVLYCVFSVLFQWGVPSLLQRSRCMELTGNWPLTSHSMILVSVSPFYFYPPPPKKKKNTEGVGGCHINKYIEPTWSMEWTSFLL